MRFSHRRGGIGLAALATALTTALTVTVAAPTTGPGPTAAPSPVTVDAVPVATVAATTDPIRATARPVTAADVRYTWRSGCPVGPSRLRVVEMNFRGYDGIIRRGMLIVRWDKVGQTAAIFRAAYLAGFKIRRMDNPNRWYGNDEEMMKADNTSAFNCRRVTGNSTRMSPHSYGTAIDVNTMHNPYKAANGVWYPPNGLRWINRNLRDPGMIWSWSTITKQVISRGGIWGGYWTYKDYQHFELG
ncbi:M15 family metallopeptidase [Terrabacter sp. GCM10028922]|uniref:M15 family metallopeptidase n=1 Tax=Terrabacter sp. GCM10028922 TaxID=3273428 RepID=UPI0036082B8B